MEQAAGDFTQDLIPDQMAVPIIDILEMSRSPRMRAVQTFRAANE